MRRAVVAAFLAVAPVAGAGSAMGTPAAERPKEMVNDLAERRALADRLNVLTGAEALTRDAMRIQVEATIPVFLKGNADRMDEVRRIVTEELMAEMDKTVPFLLAHSRDQLAAAFSVAELAEIIRFYESDVAKRLVAALPRFQREAAELGAKLGLAAVQAAIPRIIDRLRTANLATPEKL
ncbi:DUF2059 domain-containing protein [Thermaurantiacus sp.]